MHANFILETKEIFYFRQKVYAPLKNLFDVFHKVDSHTITLKQN